MAAMFLDTISPTYKNPLNNDLIGRTDTNFWDIFQSFKSKHGKIKSMDIEANNDRLRKPWDPSDPIENLFGQINDTKEYSIFAKSPLAEGTLINTGEVTILKTGILAQEYKDWRMVTGKDRTWVYLQEWWQEAYDLTEETDTSAASLGFGANIQVENDTAYNASVQNFSDGSQANAATFSNLTEVNNTLGNDVNVGMVQN